MDVQETYTKICQTQNGLGYEFGLVEQADQPANSPIQRQLYFEAKQRIGEDHFDAISFSGDAPIAYFKLLTEYDPETVRKLHKIIWNQSRIPSLYVVTPAELRIYNCYDAPVEPNQDIDTRLVHRIKVAEEVLNHYHIFAKLQFDSGEFWKTDFGRKYKSGKRVDFHLLTQLRSTRKTLHDDYHLPFSIIHDLLGRVIFILYLEDRGAIREGYYSEQFLDGTTSILHILADRDATYRLFDALAERFNGDLLPVTDDERNLISEEHLAIVNNLFGGGDIPSGQMALWRPYDFRAIPIELISAIYEEFLHKEQDETKIAKNGAYYTPHPLVEFVMNEVLPWPGPNNHEYELKILDPACGSGIFLVEAYRRLIARWMYSHNTHKIEPEQLKAILTSKIFGIDINPDAINVTAFSLYLALLDHLTPRTIWEQFQFPYLTYREENFEKSGNNLFPISTFAENAPFESDDYDLVVGNPPWKRANLPADITQYCHEHGIAQELAQAFAWRARDFSQNGTIALIVNSKTLFNNSDGDKTFRRKLLTECYLQTVVNFSALRKKRGGLGKQMFAAAVGPASILFYKAILPKDVNNEILYCTPKPTRLDSSLPHIAIDASEIQLIPREQFIDSDWTWKIGMWGTQRDYLLIEKFRNIPSLRRCIDNRQEWHKGVGLEVPEGGTNKDQDLATLPLIKTDSILRYWGKPISFEYEKLGDITYRRVGAKKTYKAPHILIKQGQIEKKFCAAYFDYDCAFRHAVSGISSTDEQMLKTIVAYLNSSFASYYLFLTVATWGVERERINFLEMLELPGLPFTMAEDVVDALAAKVEEIGRTLQREDHSVNEIADREKEIDDIIFDCLDLSTNERTLIQDVLDYSLDFFQEGEKSQACDPVFDGQLEDYAATLCNTLNSILQFGSATVWAAIFEGESPLNIVSMNFNFDYPAGTVMVVDADMNAKLTRINDKLSEEKSENIYLRRYLKLYSQDSIDIVKPNEQRFWSKSVALKDADAILAEGIIQGNSYVKQFA
jgi:type I restriction-modification system DNA methylase subunit